MVPGAVAWEGVLAVGGQAGGQEGDQEEGLGADQVGVQGEEDVASDPSDHQAYQEVSRTAGHLSTIGKYII